jgi:SAM-dependent methyltransferase
MPLHVEQLRAVADLYRINAAVGVARDLDLGDGAMDAVLLLGPLYPLRPRDQRLRALRAGWRVVRPGGPVFVAAISRWAPWLDGELRARLYESLPAIRELTPAAGRSDWMPPLFPGIVLGPLPPCSAAPGRAARRRLRVLDLVAVEGMGFMLPDLDQRLASPLVRAVVLDARATERVPELLGIGPHLLATAVRPDRVRSV